MNEQTCSLQLSDSVTLWVELLIGTRESKDSRVQAGLASPTPAFNWTTGQHDKPRTGFTGSDVGLGPARVR